MSSLVRSIRLLSLLGVLALLLAACAPGEPVGDEAIDEPVDAEPAPDGVIEITIQHMEVPPERVEATEVIIQRFNETFDEYHVRQTTVGWGEAYARATAQIAAGEQPDLLQSIPAFFTTIRATGAVQPATEIFNRLSENHTFIPSMVEQYDWDGEIWAVPAWSMVEALLYNVEHFEEAGLEPPTTWSEVLEAADALTTDGRFGIAVPAGDSFATLQAIYTWMGANQAEDIYDNACNPIIDNERTVETFEFYNKLLEFSPPDSPAYAWAEVEGALISGRASMITFKPGFLRGFLEGGNDPGAFGATRIPQPDAGGQDFSLSYSNGFMILTDDPDRQEAIYQFLDFFLQPDNYGEWLAEAEPGLFLPVTEEGGAAETFYEGEVIAQFEDVMRLQVDLLDSSRLYGFTQEAYCPEVGEFEGQFLLGKAVEQMSVGGMSPAEAVSWLQAEMARIAEEFTE